MKISTQKKKILVLTTVFPNNVESLKGIFNKHRISELAKISDLKVVAPVPWFPRIRFLMKIFPAQSKFANVCFKEENEGIEVYHPRYVISPGCFRFLYGFSYFVCVLPQILKIRKIFKFDILFCYWAYPDGFAGALFSKMFKKPLFVQVLGCDINLYSRYFLLRNLIVWALRKARKVIAVSQALATRLRELGLSEYKIAVITNGINKTVFKPLDAWECRKLLGLPFNKKIILFVGALEEVKGVRFLIEAFKNIVKERDDCILVIVGEGPLEEQVKRVTKDLVSRVVFCGARKNQEIPLWMNACDVFCLPSIREGYPNVLLEALGCSLYLVGTKVGGIPEIINSEERGLLCDQGSVEQITSALKEALTRSASRKRNFFDELKTWEQVAREVDVCMNTSLV